MSMRVLSLCMRMQYRVCRCMSETCACEARGAVGKAAAHQRASRREATGSCVTPALPALHDESTRITCLAERCSADSCRQLCSRLAATWAVVLMWRLGMPARAKGGRLLSLPPVSKLYHRPERFCRLQRCQSRSRVDGHRAQCAVGIHTSIVRCHLIAKVCSALVRRRCESDATPTA